MIYNQICRSINFEPAYIEATEAFYRVQALGGGAESHQVPGELLWQRAEPD